MSRYQSIIVRVFFVFFLNQFSVNGQDRNLPWTVSIGINAINTSVSAGGEGSWLSNHFSNSLNIKDYWNITPYISYVSFSRHLKSSWSISFMGSYNQWSRYVVYSTNGSALNGKGSNTVINPGNLFYYGLNTSLKYSFKHALRFKMLEPYGTLGGGYTFLGDSSYGTLNLGAGFTIWFSDRFGLDVSSQYNKSFGSRESNFSPNAPSYAQHLLGFVFKFGGRDQDRDGIYDFQDECPQSAGSIQFKGCPDMDGDGIIDKNDLCPDVSGTISNSGCPDSDNDGVIDIDDKCPLLPGDKANKGCPILDTDGDGVLDKDDNCPSVFGIASNSGCPEIKVPTQIVLNKIESELKNIYFHSNRAVLLNDVSTVIHGIAKILEEYPTAIFRIEGHTDATGTDLFNQNLSQARADLIRNLLIKNGVNPTNIVAVGFGESKPIATNKTPKGRARNRRVVIVLIK